MLSLKEIGIKYGTDKVEHGFCDFYEEHFSKWKNYGEFNILELGIYKGQSLQMWSEYFPDATIYGVDNLFDGPNTEKIKTKICSQCDTDIFPDVEFGIIIDDGSHVTKDQIISFGNLFKRLPSGGFYVIEDLHTSNWISYRDGLPYTSSPLHILENFNKTNVFYSQFLSTDENQYITEHIGDVKIFKKERNLDLGWNFLKDSITSIIIKK